MKGFRTELGVPRIGHDTPLRVFIDPFEQEAVSGGVVTDLKWAVQSPFESVPEVRCLTHGSSRARPNLLRAVLERGRP